MLKFERLLFVFLFVCVFSSGVNSQAPRGDLEQRRQEELNRQRRERDLDERSDNLHTMMRDSLRRDQAALNRKHSGIQKPLTKEEKARIDKILAPNEEDLIKYKDFLQQPNTGIFRLFPDIDCASNGVLRVDGNCANSVPDKWQYSFRWKDYGEDIQFKDGKLISNGYRSQGILTKLGDVSLENISTASGGMKFLLDFKPQVVGEEAKKQKAHISRGIEADGYNYTNNLKADENMTYALRLIAYRYKLGLSSGTNKRIDLTVSFRIVRRDDDGSITILWKELNRQKAPKLVFAKNEKLSDIKE